MKAFRQNIWGRRVVRRRAAGIIALLAFVSQYPIPALHRCPELDAAATGRAGAANHAHPHSHVPGQTAAADADAASFTPRAYPFGRSEAPNLLAVRMEVARAAAEQEICERPDLAHASGDALQPLHDDGHNHANCPICQSILNLTALAERDAGVAFNRLLTLQIAAQHPEPAPALAPASAPPAIRGPPAG